MHFSASPYYSTHSAIYAAESVENTSACTELAKSPSIITGSGIRIGTSKANTETTNSSASTLPKRRKLSDRGLVKSSRILIGRRIGVGSTYLAKYPIPFLLIPA